MRVIKLILFVPYSFLKVFIFTPSLIGYLFGWISEEEMRKRIDKFFDFDWFFQ
jgi:hypothetical protein